MKRTDLRKQDAYGQGLSDAALVVSVVISAIALSNPRQAGPFIVLVWVLGLVALLLRTSGDPTK